MSATLSLFQTAVGAVGNTSLFPVVRGLVGFSLFAGLVMLFRPLLTGMLHALTLVVKPSLTPEQRAARRHMRDAQMMQRLINSCNAPSHAAELRAIAARE